MKFDFNFGPQSSVALAMGKTAARRFTNASDRKHDAHNLDDKVWVRDVLRMFADKCDITFAQAVQAVRTSRLDCIQEMHTRAAEKLPVFIEVINVEGKLEKIKNPEREKLVGFSEMQPHLHEKMCREHLAFSSAIRHPKDSIPKGHPREQPVANETANKASQRFHPDETHQAHRQRLAAALQVALNPSNDNVEKLGSAFGL